MLDRVEVDVVDVSLEIDLISNLTPGFRFA